MDHPDAAKRMEMARKAYPKFKKLIDKRDKLLEEFETLCETGLYGTGETPYLSFHHYHRDAEWMVARLFNLPITVVTKMFQQDTH